MAGVQQARPLAYPCFEDPSRSECVAIKNGLLNEYVRSDTYDGFMNMQGEACSSDPSDQCLLDPTTLAVPGNDTCGQGAVSRYYVEVHDAADVQAIFEYAELPGAETLSIMNTGVDRSMRGYASLLAESLPQWALLRWGGASNANLSVLANPILSNATEAAEQLAAAVSYVQSHSGGSVSFTIFPSYFEYFTQIVNGTLAGPDPISASTIYTSRIVPISTLANETTRTAVVDAVLQLGNTKELNYGILANMPLRYVRANADRNTSLNPAWFEGGVYLVVYVTWLSTHTLSERKALVRLYREATSLMQSVAPDGATYANEADPRMDGWAEAFWGDNYGKLLDIKGQVDPNNLLS